MAQMVRDGYRLLTVLESVVVSNQFKADGVRSARPAGQRQADVESHHSGW